MPKELSESQDSATIERLADPMSEYSIGIEDHYAWANLVNVTTSGPNEILLDKRRVELLDQELTASPYHLIYHQALTQAAAQLNLRVFYFEKGNVLELAAQARGKTARDLERQLKEFGTTLGPPWRKGHVVACAGAIVAHVSAAPLNPKRPRQKGRAEPAVPTTIAFGPTGEMS